MHVKMNYFLENKQLLEKFVISKIYTKYLMRFQGEFTKLDKRVEDKYWKKKKESYAKWNQIKNRKFKRRGEKTNRQLIFETNTGIKSFNLKKKKIEKFNSYDSLILLKLKSKNKFKKKKLLTPKFVSRKKKITPYIFNLLQTLRHSQTLKKNLLIISIYKYQKESFIAYYNGIRGRITKKHLMYGKQKLYENILCLKAQKFNWKTILKLNKFYFNIKILYYVQLQFHNLRLSHILWKKAKKYKKQFKKNFLKSKTRRKRLKKKSIWVFSINKNDSLKK